MTQSMVTIFDLLGSTAKRMPDRIFIEGEQPVSYSKAYILAKRTANYLHQILPPKTDFNQRVVGIFAEKSVMTVLLPFAVSALGDIFVNVNENYTAKYIDHVVRDTNMQLLLFCSQKRNILDQKQITCRKVDLNEVILAIEEKANDCKEFPHINNLDSYVSTVFYTSGSTGMPKGIAVPHHSLMDGSDVVAGFLGMQSSDCVMSLLPYSFDYGFNQILASVRVGAKVFLHNYLFPNNLLKALDEQKITNLAATPSLWNSIYKFSSSHPEMFKRFPKLRRITNTGGAIPDKTWSFLLEWSKRDNFKFFPIYGLSEAFRSTYLDPKHVEDKCGSIGKPVPGVDIQIIREDLTICDANETGEIVHRGKFISNGYLNNPEANRKTFRDDPLNMPGVLPNRAVFSGDFGYRDEEGFLYCLGRKDDQIKIRDYRVNASEIEAEMNAIDFVISSKLLVFYEGQLHEPVLRAFVILSDLRTHEQEALIIKLKKYLKYKLPNYAQPKSIHILESFPMNANFKVDSEKLRQNLIESSEV